MRRLQTRSQFQTVLSGSVIAKSNHFALHCRDSLSLEGKVPGAHASLIEPLIGALLPKRWAKRAVTRNMIKRQIFQVGQEFESLLKGFAYVVRLRHAFDRAQFVSASSIALKVSVRHELHSLFTMATARLPNASHV